MLIVDAQVHIWANHKPTNANHRQVETYSADDLLAEMDEGGVHAAVVHPPASWDPDSNELAVEAARRHPDRLAILGNFPLDAPASRGLVDGWKRRPGMLGLRFALLQPRQRTWPTDGTMDWLWPAAERAGLPIALLAATYLPTVGEIAEQYPRLKLIIDHLGRPSSTKDEAAWANLPEMLALAKHPNVAIKATGAPRSYPGSRDGTSSWSWAARSATGSTGRFRRAERRRAPARVARCPRLGDGPRRGPWPGAGSGGAGGGPGRAGRRRPGGGAEAGAG